MADGQKDRRTGFFSEILNYFVHFLKAEIGLNAGGKNEYFHIKAGFNYFRSTFTGS